MYRRSQDVLKVFLLRRCMNVVIKFSLSRFLSRELELIKMNKNLIYLNYKGNFTQEFYKKLKISLPLKFFYLNINPRASSWKKDLSWALFTESTPQNIDRELREIKKSWIIFQRGHFHFHLRWRKRGCEMFSIFIALWLWLKWRKKRNNITSIFKVNSSNVSAGLKKTLFLRILKRIMSRLI